MCVVYNGKLPEGVPATHALVVGVSEYDYLPDADDELSASPFGLRRLTSAAGTAAAFAEWLTANAGSLPRPLATVRLLIAPTDSERERHAAHCEASGSPTLRSFLMAAEAWRADLVRSDDNAAFFYFVGHGLQGPAADEVLLLHDFGEPGGSPLRNGITTNSLVAGMAPMDSHPTVPRLQLYFFDACRGTDRVLRRMEAAQATDAFTYELSHQDYRQVAKYHAAIPGGRARSEINGTTIFGEAVLACLSGAAGERSPDGGWHVSVGSLGRALSLIEKKVRVEDDRIRFDPQPRGDQMTSIVQLARTPAVDVTLALKPDEIISSTGVRVRNGRGEPVALPIPLVPHPYQCTWLAGAYAIDTEDQASGSLSEGEYKEVLPPFWQWVGP
jgi:caspase domain-containing protein